jgi:hypothetical protein
MSRYPETFASYFNELKERAEDRLLVRHGSVEVCQRLVSERLALVNELLDGVDVDVVFLVAGQIVASIVNLER